MSGWWRPDLLKNLSDSDLVSLIQVACAEAFGRGELVTQRAREGLLTEAELTAIRVAADRMAEPHILRDEARRRAAETIQRTRREADEKAEREKREKVEAERKATEEAVKRGWRRKKWVALEIRALMPDEAGLSVKVWRGGAEARVYIGRGFDDSDVDYYATGNRKYPPGSLRVTKAWMPHRDALKLLCARIAAHWSEIKFDVDQAAAWDGEPLALSELSTASKAPA